MITSPVEAIKSKLNPTESQDTQSKPAVMSQQDNGLDPQAVNLAKAIRQHESQGNFQAVGKSNEYGAYQYTPETWAGDSQKYLGQPIPLQAATPEQQNEVAYKKIKELKDQGYNVGQIASIWNSGSPEWQGKVGINQYGVQYDVPKYVDAVANLYQQYKSQSPVQETAPVKMEQKGPMLGQELTERVSDLSKGVSTIIGGKDATGQTRVSGLIQGAGALAGAVGDVTGKALELIPGVKWVEKQIGKGIGALANTEVGQSIINELQQQAAKHPELAKDAESVFNIVTAIPILKGLAVAKNVALDATAQALKGYAEKAFATDLTEAASRTIGGRNALKTAPNSIKTLIDERALPEIEGGKLNVNNAKQKLSQTINDIEENELQPTLDKLSTERVADRESVDNLKKLAIQEIKSDPNIRDSGMIKQAISQAEKRFDGWKESFGDYVDLKTTNRMKRGVRKFVNWGSPEGDADYIIGQSLQKYIENIGTKYGLGDINAINDKMGNLIKAQNLLRHIDNKPINSGVFGNTIKNVATGAGEVIGESTGVPFAGALIGRNIGGGVGKKLTGGIEGILKRTGKDAVKTSKEEIKSKTKGLLKNVAAQKLEKAAKR